MADLRSKEIKNGYPNIVTIGATTDDDPTTGTLENGKGTNLTSVTVDGAITADGAVTVNESGGDNDFRVEGNTEPNLLFTDANTDRVAIGTNSPSVTLHVNGTDAIKIPVGTTAERPTGADGFIRYNSDNDEIEAYADGEWVVIEDSTSERLLGVEAYAIQLLRIHNPSLVFSGFVDTQTVTPSNSINKAYIAIEDGTIFGISGVLKGQVIEDDGNVFSVKYFNVKAYETDLYVNEDKRILASNGVEDSTPGGSTTDYIRISPDYPISVIAYSSATAALIAFYDKDKNFISSVSGADKNYVLTVIDVNSIPEGATYIRSTALTEKGGFLDINSFSNINEDLYSEFDLLNEEIDFLNEKIEDKSNDESYYTNTNKRILASNGAEDSAQTGSVTDYIKISPDYPISIIAYSSSTAALLAFYDKDKTFISSISGADKNYVFTVIQPSEIPDGTSYIRSTALTTQGGLILHSELKNEVIKPYEIYNTNYTNINKRILASNGYEDSTPGGSVTDFIRISPDYPISVMAYSSATAALIAFYDKNQNFISAISGADKSYVFTVIDVNTIPENAAYIRSTALTAQGGLILYSLVFDFDKIIRLTDNNLEDVKISVIGDSISTYENQNAVEIEILSTDVGNQISAYALNDDVGKTIGGYTIQNSDRGTEITVTPTINDVGKTIGQANNFNTDAKLGTFDNLWVKKLVDYYGMTLLQLNCHSGASFTTARSTDNAIYIGTQSWRPSTIRKCKKRDEQGNYINPDIILIARGTNDFSYTDDNGNYPIITDTVWDGNWDIPNSDIVQIGGVNYYGFREALALTIHNLREAYPFAKILCSTMSNFKRLNSDNTFPLDNGTHTFNEYNQAIRQVCDYFGVDVIELDKNGITYQNVYEGSPYFNSGDLTHPNALGHNLFFLKSKNQIINYI